MSRELPLCSLLDAGALPVGGIAQIAKREGMRPRPVYQAHKWFARRFATTARSLLVAATSNEGADFWRAYYGGSLCENLVVLDPFMGGGVMLLEAARLGASIQGVDIEPVATVVSDFQGRLWDLPELGEALARLKERAGERMAPLYASEDEEGLRETLLHGFWVQTGECARCDHAFDIHPRFSIAWDETARKRWSACRSCNRVIESGFAATSVSCSCGVVTDPHEGHSLKGAAVCPCCGHTERLIDMAGRTGKPRFRLFAVETIPSGPERRYANRDRRIRSASAFDVAKAEEAAAELKALLVGFPNCLPLGPIPTAGRSDDRLIRYGYSDYVELFNARQKLHLATLAAEIEKLDNSVREAMAIAFSDHLITNNMMCGYAGGWRRLSPLFAIRAFRHIARPIEINPWLEHNGRGTYPNAVRAIANAAKSLKASTETTVEGLAQHVPPHRPRGWNIRCGDARNLDHLRDGSIDLVLTDPPYFDYISYSELGHFFVPWLVRFGLVDAEHLAAFPEGQLASTRRSQAGADAFATNLGAAFGEIARVCKAEGRIVFTYQNLDGRGWASLAEAMASAGIIPISAFPLFGDGASGLHKHANSISWDCVLVCAPGVVASKPDLKAHDADGIAFAEQWAKKLETSGHVLSPGDKENLRQGGALLAALSQAKDALVESAQRA